MTQRPLSKTLMTYPNKDLDTRGLRKTGPVHTLRALASSVRLRHLIVLGMIGTFLYYAMGTSSPSLKEEASGYTTTPPVDIYNKEVLNAARYYFSRTASQGVSYLEPVVPDNATIAIRERIRSKSEVKGITKEHYTEVCSRPYILTDVRLDEPLKVIKEVRRYSFCYLSQAADIYLPTCPEVAEMEPAAAATVFPWYGDFLFVDEPYAQVFEGAAKTGNELYIRKAVRAKETHVKYQVPIRDSRDVLSGKGITLTLADHMLPYVLGLIGQLKLIGSEYPIELFIRSGFKQESMEAIRKAVADYPGRATMVNLDDFLPEHWVQQVQGFNNKPFALIHSRFEEVLYVDADTVPLTDLDKFFELPAYKEKGLFLFRDILVGWTLKDASVSFLKGLMPGAGGSNDEDYILPSTDFTLDNYFLGKGRNSYVESGLFVVRKTTHLPGIFMTIAIVMQNKIQEIFYGDKEAFWLAQSLAGNEQYQINDIHAAGIGLSDYYEGPGDGDNNVEPRVRVCSTHPAHVSPVDNELMWVNSGLDICKFDHIHGEEISRNSTFYFDSIIVLSPEDPATFYYPLNTCADHTWCVTKPLSSKKSKHIKFSPAQKKVYDYMSEQWMLNAYNVQ